MRDEEPEDDHTVDLPLPGSSPGEIMAYLNACAAALCRCEVGRKRFDSLIAVAPKILNAWKADREARDLPDMEAKLEELRALRTELNAQAEQIRQGRVPH